MTRDEILGFIKSHPACFLATAEAGGQPHARGMLMKYLDASPFPLRQVLLARQRLDRGC